MTLLILFVFCVSFVYASEAFTWPSFLKNEFNVLDSREIDSSHPCRQLLPRVFTTYNALANYLSEISSLGIPSNFLLEDRIYLNTFLENFIKTLESSSTGEFKHLKAYQERLYMIIKNPGDFPPLQDNMNDQNLQRQSNPQSYTAVTDFLIFCSISLNAEKYHFVFPVIYSYFRCLVRFQFNIGSIVEKNPYKNFSRVLYAIMTKNPTWKSLLSSHWFENVGSKTKYPDEILVKNLLSTSLYTSDNFPGPITSCISVFKEGFSTIISAYGHELCYECMYWIFKFLYEFHSLLFLPIFTFGFLEKTRFQPLSLWKDDPLLATAKSHAVGLFCQHYLSIRDILFKQTKKFSRNFNYVFDLSALIYGKAVYKDSPKKLKIENEEYDLDYVLEHLQTNSFKKYELFVIKYMKELLPNKDFLDDISLAEQSQLPSLIVASFRYHYYNSPHYAISCTKLKASLNYEFSTFRDWFYYILCDLAAYSIDKGSISHMTDFVQEYQFINGQMPLSLNQFLDRSCALANRVTVSREIAETHWLSWLRSWFLTDDPLFRVLYSFGAIRYTTIPLLAQWMIVFADYTSPFPSNQAKEAIKIRFSPSSTPFDLIKKEYNQVVGAHFLPHNSISCAYDQQSVQLNPSLKEQMARKWSAEPSFNDSVSKSAASTRINPQLPLPKRSSVEQQTTDDTHTKDTQLEQQIICIRDIQFKHYQYRSIVGFLFSFTCISVISVLLTFILSRSK